MRKKLLNKKTGVQNRRTDDRAKRRALRKKSTHAQILGELLLTPAEVALDAHNARIADPKKQLGAFEKGMPYASAQKHKTAVYAGGAIHTHLPKGKGHMISRPAVEV